LGRDTDLKKYIRDLYGDSIIEIMLVGSRVGGWWWEKSDYDIVLVLDTDESPRDLKRRPYNGTQLNIYLQNRYYDTHTNIYWNKYELPAYHMLANTYLKGNEGDILKYIERKKREWVTNQVIGGEGRTFNLDEVHRIFKMVKNKPRVFEYTGDWVRI